MSNIIILAETILKCLNFLPEMSGILDTRIPTVLQLCIVNNKHVVMSKFVIMAKYVAMI